MTTRLLFTLSICISAVFCRSITVYVPQDTTCETRTPGPSGRLGYVPSPDGRGTLQILWGSIFALFLCSWSALFLHVPAPTDTQIRIFRRRFLLTGLVVLAPELLFAGGLNQWLSARRSVRAFRDSGEQGWTMTHAFFADSGGFVLDAPDRAPFPLNGKQLHFLVMRGYVDMPRLSRKQIEDKNKVDRMLRAVTLWQIFWFSVNIAARLAVQLPITTLELTTFAFIVCSSLTSLLGFMKPADVRTSEVIKCKYTIEHIVNTAIVEKTNFGTYKDPKVFRFTPLDFISREEWHWSILWSNWINLACLILRVDPSHAHPRGDRIMNTYTIPFKGLIYGLLLGVSYIYGSIFLLAWNHKFPSETEQLIWRICSISVLLSMMLYDLVEKFGFRWWPAIRARYLADKLWYKNLRNRFYFWEPRHPFLKRVHNFVNRALKWLRNNSPGQHKELDVPLKVAIPMYFLGAVYLLSRGTILILDFIELRSLPPEAYETVDWSSMLPHM
ncbi:hypothetical protein K461DRAFT_260127 [Myriangium duriaei CBS 260.36]|uniref:Wax synthase domain-containing protein n=1 Tax=Myriangium duriaei CBS 260.36 TaxID=1168546 RepID=A0A9P4MEL6_9PEZI|nr:hypothetical protein K461DRAFT_260127 [Myriangium duriaei CBS 260.36]